MNADGFVMMCIVAALTFGAGIWVGIYSGRATRRCALKENGATHCDILNAR